jgi:hypothetical protein
MMKSPQTFFLCTAAIAVKVAEGADALRDLAGAACKECKTNCNKTYVHSFAQEWQQFNSFGTGDPEGFCNAPAYDSNTFFGCVGGPNAKKGSYSPQQCSASDCGSADPIYSLDKKGALSINVEPSAGAVPILDDDGPRKIQMLFLVL